MSAARLSSPMPSIDGILEGNAESQAQNSAVHEGVDASSSTPTPASLLPTAIPLHLMKTMGHRDNDIEKEEVEVFSFVLGFPDGTDPDKDAKPNTEDAQIIFEERREDKIAELQHKEEPQAPAHWFEINFAQWMVTIRRLFPIRFCEFFLRKAGQDLAQH